MGIHLKRFEVVDVGEYKITIDYQGDGKVDVTVYDELGDEIEGLYISNDEEATDDDQIDFNPN